MWVGSKLAVGLAVTNEDNDHEKMIKNLVIVILIGSALIFYVQYRERIRKETVVSIETKYEKASTIKRFAPKTVFVKFSKAMPRTASFIIGLDPNTSDLAIHRWVFLIFIGWFHFCFLTSYPKYLNKYRKSRSDLFCLPVGTILLLSVGSVILGLEGTIKSIVGYAMILIMSLVVSISLLSIPTSIVWLIVAMVRSLSKIVKGSNETQIVTKPELPSPIVHRKMINGVWYDEEPQ